MATYYVKSGVATIWAATTAYVLGARVAPTLAYGVTAAKGRVYECTTAGTSGGTEPTWNTTVGGTTTDGGVTWTTRDITTWTNACPYLHYALNYRVVAGDTIYVSQAHAESVAQTDNFTSPGTAALPVRILSANDSATPPVALLSGASVTSTSNQTIIMSGYAYSYGISYTIGSGQIGNNSLQIGQYFQAFWWKLEQGTINIASTGVGGIILGSSSNASSAVPQKVHFENIKVQFGNTSDNIKSSVNFTWRNTASAISGTPPTSLFSFPVQPCQCILDGVDISALSGTIVTNGSGIGANIYLQNCKLNAGVTLVSGTSTGQGDTEVYMHNCDSGATTYRLYEYKYTGNTSTETTLVRTSGASDGTTTISWKMISFSNTFFYSNLDSPWISQWQNTTGAAKTATVEILHDSLTALTNADIYLEVEYFATTNPGTSFANNRATDILATPAAHGSSTATWTTTGMTNPNKQKLVVTFTPGMVGPVRVKVYLLKPSYTVYIDPLVTIA